MEDFELGRYRHFKGGIYVVTAIAKHTENGLKYVVYHSEENPSEVWIRPYNHFFSGINPYKYPGAKQTERFVMIHAT